MIDIIKTLHFTNMAWLLLLPVAMMAIDIVTGVINAWKQKDFQSTKMRAGLAKKAGELLIIVVGVLFTYGLGVPDYIIKFISLYIIVMELMSIIENIDKLGVPLPKAIKDVINNAGQGLQDTEASAIIARYQDEIRRLEEQLREKSADDLK